MAGLAVIIGHWPSRTRQQVDRLGLMRRNTERGDYPIVIALAPAVTTSGEQNGTANELPSLVGQVVNGLEIQQLLGQGGMGQVYLAYQQGLNIPRALKVIRGEHKGDAAVLKRFRREAQVLGRLHHHHIIQVLDFGEIGDGAFYISMEYIEGADLEDLVQRRGPMDLVSGLLILRDVADALRYAHSQGVIHRDLKPGNIVLRDRQPGQSKIIDFGLVRVASDTMLTKLTKEDQILGSPLYLSPEQGQGRESLTGAVDVYALAGVAYYLLSGAPVFPVAEHDTILKLVVAHLHGTPTKLSERCSVEIPAFLNNLLLACLSKNPDNRPTAEEIYFHLERLHIEEQAKRHMRTPAPRDQATAESQPEEQRRAARQLAAQIWQDPDTWSPGSDRSLREAYATQIEAALLHLTAVLIETSTASAELRNHIARIQRVQDSLGDLGLEAALVESHAGERIGSRQADLRRQQVLMNSRIDELQTALRVHFCDLFVSVVTQSAEPQHASARQSRAELEELLHSYRQEPIH